MKPTQHHLVLSMLVKAGADGVCAERFYSSALPNARNRVGDLRARGHCITSAPCADPHGPTYFRYWLHHGPERTCAICRPEPVQQRLMATG